MKTATVCLMLLTACASAPTLASDGGALSPERWSVRIDLGGNVPETPKLTLHDGPVTGGDSIELSAGFQMNVALGFRFTPWLSLEGELGFAVNEVESVGNWSYPNSSMSQLSFMANLVFELPRGPLVPFAGIGAGGVFSSLSFGNHSYYYYIDSDGYGTDCVFAAQAFAGLRYNLGDKVSVGVNYRYLVMDRQKWDVDWWTGSDFTIGVDSFGVHSLSLSFTLRF